MAAKLGPSSRNTTDGSNNKIEVLCPNGHRVYVKTTHRTRLLEVVDEACAKQAFLPVLEYTVKHGRKELNLSFTLRDAGLPQLAKLELVKLAKPRCESDVTVALQLPSGERLLHNFPPSSSLWQVLMHWHDEETRRVVGTSESAEHPVCVYMREEVVGEYALRHTTLRHLGLTGGKAAFRVLHRAVDEESLAGVRAQVERDAARRAKVEQLTQTAAAKMQAEAETASNTTPETNNTSTTQPSGSSRAPPTQQTDSVKSQAPPTQQTDIVTSQASNSRQTEPVPSEAGATHTQTDSLKQNSAQPRHTSGQHEAMETNETSLNSANSTGLSIGQLLTPGQMQLTQQQQQMAHELAASLGLALPGQQPVRTQRSRALQPRDPQPEFKFPEETRGQNLYENDMSDVDRSEFQPCDREPVLFSLQTQNSQNMELEEPGDEFFQVTEKDVRNLWADTQRKMRDMDDQPLMTRVLRDATRDAQMSRYSRVALRLRLNEQLCVQALFRPRETVHALHVYVRDLLRDPEQSFYLYTSPPRCVLKDQSATLIQAKLAPMSVVYFGSENKSDACFAASLLERLCTVDEADRVLLTHMQPTADTTDVTSQRAGARDSRTGAGPGKRSTAATSGGKAPKWFTMGKK